MDFLVYLSQMPEVSPHQYLKVVLVLRKSLFFDQSLDFDTKYSSYLSAQAKRLLLVFFLLSVRKHIRLGLPKGVLFSRSHANSTLWIHQMKANLKVFLLHFSGLKPLVSIGRLACTPRKRIVAVKYFHSD